MKRLALSYPEFKALRALAGDSKWWARVTDGVERLAKSWPEAAREIVGPIPDGDYLVEVIWTRDEPIPFEERLAWLVESGVKQ